MAFISKLNIGSGGNTNSYDIKDKNAQPKDLTNPIEVGGSSKTTVESCLEALAQNGGGGGTDAYVDGTTLYLPTDKASVSEGKLIIA